MLKLDAKLQPEYFNFGDFKKNKKNDSTGNFAFIKKQVHESHIDQFFRTNIEAPPKKSSGFALLSSIAGVAIPILTIGKIQKPDLKLNSLKNIFKSADINYGLKEILAVGLGGVIGGLIGGLADKNERKKTRKIKEAAYQLINLALPAILVSGAIKGCGKIKRLNNPVAKIAATALGIFTGANAAVGIANKLENNLFDPYNISPDRKIKKKDLVVHVDDLIGTLVIAKIPLVEKLHLNKALPVIFAWCGYHVGDK